MACSCPAAIAARCFFKKKPAIDGEFVNGGQVDIYNV